MHYSLNGENEIDYHRQWLAIYKCPLRAGITVDVTIIL